MSLLTLTFKAPGRIHKSYLSIKKTICLVLVKLSDSPYRLGSTYAKRNQLDTSHILKSKTLKIANKCQFNH